MGIIQLLIIYKKSSLNSSLSLKGKLPHRQRRFKDIVYHTENENSNRQNANSLQLNTQKTVSYRKFEMKQRLKSLSISFVEIDNNSPLLPL